MKLYKAQQDVFNEIKKSCLLPLGTSTGKTLISLEWYTQHYPNEMLYIITPAAKKNEGGWDREIQQHYSIKNYKVISYTMLKKSDFSKGVFILDECHYIKNPTSIRGKEIKLILKKYAVDFIMLSATPGTKVEEYANYFILWGLVKNKTEFYKKYIISQTSIWGYKEIVGYKNLEEFNKIIKDHSTKCITVNDIVELDPIIYKDIDLKKPIGYDKLVTDRVLYKEDEVIKLDTLPKLCTTLRMVCNTKGKLEYLKYLLGSTTDNIVIFYNFKEELKELINIISKDKLLYIINGDTKVYPKKQDFDKITNSVTLVQYRAGGTGIELTYGNIVIFYSPTYSYQDYEQSLGRCYRHGQHKKVIVYRFKCKGTIEQNIYKCLEKKQDFNNKMWEV